MVYIDIRITNHAVHRLKERCGLPKKAHERNASSALAKGIRHDECSGYLKGYLNELFLSHGNGNNIRIYINYVYIFCDENLITVLTLPHKFRAAVNKILTKRRRLCHDLAELGIAPQSVFFPAGKTG